MKQLCCKKLGHLKSISKDDKIKEEHRQILEIQLIIRRSRTVVYFKNSNCDCCEDLVHFVRDSHKGRSVSSNTLARKNPMSFNSNHIAKFRNEALKHFEVD